MNIIKTSEKSGNYHSTLPSRSTHSSGRICPARWSNRTQIHPSNTPHLKAWTSPSHASDLRKINPHRITNIHRLHRSCKSWTSSLADWNASCIVCPSHEIGRFSIAPHRQLFQIHSRGTHSHPFCFRPSSHHTCLHLDSRIYLYHAFSHGVYIPHTYYLVWTLPPRIRYHHQCFQAKTTLIPSWSSPRFLSFLSVLWSFCRFHTWSTMHL